MQYHSTRGDAPVLSFDEVALAGLASDGGLYLPQSVPTLSAKEIEALRGLPYAELAFRILQPFMAGSVPDEVLKTMLDESYATFRHAAVAPTKQLGENQFLLELFHGPTLAFKDFALQFLGRLMDYLLKERGERASVLGATSGDTGSAAISGFRGKDQMDIFILFPQGRISDVQRRQMTTVSDANVHCLAVEGAFDDCQNIVKALFRNQTFRTEQKLVAVNSINWARIMAQIVYYFYAALALGAPARPVSFSVPTGNFGDIYAGYIAKQMGLPIDQLVIATNRNDILARCLESGTYGMEGVVPTISPSMDIQISSNFERLLFNLHGQDGARIKQLMDQFMQSHSITLEAPVHDALKADFASMAIDDDRTKATIRDTYAATGELLDPHTAIGVAAAASCHRDLSVPMVTLATAHPAKFPDAVKEASNVHPELPVHMADLFDRDERMVTIENAEEAVMRHVETHSRASG